MNNNVIKVDDNNEIVVDEKVLTTLLTGETIRVKNELDLSAGYDIDFNQLIYRVEKAVLAEHLADDIYTGYSSCDHPKSTWQMFKHKNQYRWWMRWLVRKRPVVMDVHLHSVKVKVGRYAKYPEAKVVVPQLGRPVPYETIREV